jgi:transposase
MHMLAELADVVIGSTPTSTPTHRRGRHGRHPAPWSSKRPRRLPRPATRQLLALATRHSGRRLWAVEGTGGYGAGLTRFLAAQAEQVVELERPKRATRRHGAKSDPIDATRAAREALSRDRLAQPRSAGTRAGRSRHS